MILRRLVIGTIIATSAVTPLSGAEISHDVNDDGSAIIILSGEIAAGDDQLFRELSVKFPRALVGLDSSGGALLPALEIGRIIRLRGYTTAVAEDMTCTSACALIWLAGSPRILDRNGKLGFHASYKDEGGRLVETGVGNAMAGYYLSQLNLSQRAVVFATQASPYEISWLTEGNKIGAGIEFSSFGEARAAPSKIDKQTLPPPIIVPPSPPRMARVTATTLRASFGRSGLIETISKQAGLPVAQQSIYADHLRQLFSNDLFLTRLANEMNDAVAALHSKNAEDVAFEISSALMQRLIFNGLLRMSDTDIRRFIMHFSAVGGSSSLRECQSIFWPAGKVDAAVEFRVIGRQGDGALREYLSLLRKAVSAELDQKPSQVRLNPTQLQAADSANAEALARSIDRLSAAEATRVQSAIDDMDSAPQVDQCSAMRVILTTATQMPGIAGDWYRRRFVELMGSE